MMKSSKRYFVVFNFIFLATGALLRAQDSDLTAAEKDTLLSVAHHMMAKARYCAFVTLDSTGRPNARTMDPFPPDDKMVVWLGTNRNSRKVREIRNDPRVTLYYPDPDFGGYVSIAGRAEVINDAEKKEHYWKKEWASFYEDRELGYILIKVTPLQVDVLSYKNNLIGDRKTWRIPHIQLHVKK